MLTGRTLATAVRTATSRFNVERSGRRLKYTLTLLTATLCVVGSGTWCEAAIHYAATNGSLTNFRQDSNTTGVDLPLEADPLPANQFGGFGFVGTAASAKGLSAKAYTTVDAQGHLGSGSTSAEARVEGNVPRFWFDDQPNDLLLYAHFAISFHADLAANASYGAGGFGFAETQVTAFARAYSLVPSNNFVERYGVASTTLENNVPFINREEDIVLAVLNGQAAHFQFSVSARSQASTFVDPDATAHTHGDISHTIEWHGLSYVTDQFGNVLQGTPHIIDSEGVDWSQPAPEPSGLGLLAMSAIAVVRRPRRANP